MDRDRSQITFRRENDHMYYNPPVCNHMDYNPPALGTIAAFISRLQISGGV